MGGSVGKHATAARPGSRPATQQEFRNACRDGDVASVDRLLADATLGDPTAVCDEKNRIPLAWAAANGHLAVVARLLQDRRVDPAAPAARSNQAMRLASANGHVAVVERLLRDERVDPAAVDNYAIIESSRDGHLAVVERLLQDDRVDPSANDNLAIRMASSSGHLAVVERLLHDARVAPAADENHAIQEASRYGHLDVVERLMQDERVDPAARYNAAIRAACNNGHSAVVDRLLQDERVDPAGLHQPAPDYFSAQPYPVSKLTDGMLSPLAVSLSLPFPDSSCIRLWQPRLRQFRMEQIAFMETLIASWRWHRGGMCRDVMDHIVSEYVFGMKLREYCGLDAEYVAPPVLLVDPTTEKEGEDNDEGEVVPKESQATAAVTVTAAAGSDRELH
jgi:surface antigen